MDDRKFPKNLGLLEELLKLIMGYPILKASGIRPSLWGDY